MFFKKHFKDQNFQFGLLISTVTTLIFFYKLLYLNTLSISLLLTSTTFLTFTIFFSKVFLYPLKLWIKFGFFLGLIVTPLFLTLVYILTIIPISLLIRIFNYDILKMKKSNHKSYWITRNQKSTHFRDQF